MVLLKKNMVLLKTNVNLPITTSNLNKTDVKEKIITSILLKPILTYH